MSVSIVPELWPGPSNYVRPKPKRKKCGVCGCKIRGKNHEDGYAHKNKVKAK